jgi:hypothetical protein
MSETSSPSNVRIIAILLGSIALPTLAASLADSDGSITTSGATQGRAGTAYLGDVDGDGNGDVAVGEDSDVCIYPTSIGDHNGDGYNDMAVISSTTNSSHGFIKVFEGSSTGLGSTPAQEGTDYHNGRKIQQIEHADFDQDGYEDIVTTGNNGAGGFILYGPLDFSTGAAHQGRKITFGNLALVRVPSGRFDVNGDGWVDMATKVNPGPYGQHNIGIFYGSAAGFSSSPDLTLTRQGATFQQGALFDGDFDGDGDIDVLAKNATNTLTYYENDGGVLDTYGVALAKGLNLAYTWGLGGDVMDVNGDGFDDLVRWMSPGSCVDYLEVMYGSSTGPIGTWSRVNLGTGCSGSTAVNVFDIDNDGVDDAVYRAGTALFWEWGTGGNTDSDGDGVPDSEDICDGHDDNLDADEDGVPNGCDLCPNDSANDVDLDGYCADEDNCPVTENSDQSDADFDGYGDVCDICVGDDDTEDSDLDGVCDDLDAFPQDPAYSTDTDGDGVADQLDQCEGYDDLDNSDADGYPDGCDICPMDAENDADMDGYCESEDNCQDLFNDQLDTDSDGQGDACDADDDGDGVPDDLDAFPLDSSEYDDFDGDGVGDNADTDDDNDGVSDDLDAFPYDPNESVDTDGDGIGDNADYCFGDDAYGDTDEDGVCDDVDFCPTDPDDTDEDGDLICDVDDLCAGDNSYGDADGDQVCEDIDICTGNDATGDTDGDFTCDDLDNCPVDANEDQADDDGDGIGTACETDTDSDGVIDDDDNCDDDFNPDQADTDGDAEGDVCDTDDDGDGIADTSDNCPLVASADQTDFDGDGLGDVCDGDDDADGVDDDADLCPATPMGVTFNSDGCSGAQYVDLTVGSCEDYSSHGKYVSAVTQAANTAVKQGLLTGREKGVITSSAAKSSCGK